MEKNLVTEAERFLHDRHKDKRRTQALRIVAVAVVFVTIYALILPAVTMSNEVECGSAEHIHTESCWQEQLTPPQPQMVCPVQGSGAVVLHAHDSSCYDGQGALVCALEERAAHTHGPDCYREHRELICTEVPDPGHAHTASCYAQDRGEELTCGMEESGAGHTHTDDCYRQERSDELICGQEEGEDHAHSDGCYRMVPVKRELKCFQEEGPDQLDEEGNVLVPGHSHTAECWMTEEELRICGQQESQGHSHTDSCYAWTPRLTCQEEERPAGHVHTDGCYEIEQLFVCLEQELASHSHDGSCYDETGALVCGLSEVLAHQHTADCFFTPEGEAEPVRTLICGQEEHQHDERCYVQVEQVEGPAFYCGQQEHIHTMPDCFFESGALRCTIREHVHDLTCLEPPAEPTETPGPEVSEPLDPEGSQEPEQPDQVLLENREFEYTDEEGMFTVTFRVNGVVRPVQEQPLPAQDPLPAPSGEIFLELAEEFVPLAAMPRMSSLMSAFIQDDDPADAPPPAFEEPTDIDSVTAGPAAGPNEGTAGTADSQVPLFPEENTPAPAPTPEAVPSPEPEQTAAPSLPAADENGDQQDRVEICVEELAEDDPRLGSILDEVRKTQDMDSTILLKGLAVSVTVDGKPADTSGCEIMASIQPTRTLIDAVNQDESGLMTADEDDPAEDGEEQLETETALNVFTSNGLEKIVPLTENAEAGAPEQAEANLMTLSNDGIMMMSLTREPYPVFQVQYYAYLHTVDTKENADPKKPTLIDTNNGGKNNGGNLPVNGNTNLGAIHMEVDEHGNIQTLAENEKVTKIFNDHRFSYETAPHRNYIDIVTKQDGNYKLTGIWVMEADGETVKRTYTHTAEKPIQLTNNATTAKLYPEEYVLVEKDTILRLVYETTDGSKSVDSNFHDYDISDGKVYSNADKNSVVPWPGKDSTGMYMFTKDVGIHTTGNYKGQTGTKYAFGNGTNAATGLGNVTWNGYYINKANGSSFQNCTFKLVQDTLPIDGRLQFSSGIVAPNLFNAMGEKVEGRTDHDGGLGFIRKGDTYTLSTASVDGQVTASGLERLSYSRLNYSKTLRMFSNEFWPLDNVASAGTAGHDLMFGRGSGQHHTFGDGTTPPTLDSDYKTSPQNGLHNPYFGMDFAVDFTVYPDYVGPLEYYFFGDDDMWVYLSPCDENGNLTGPGKLICDIGGVHGAVGEYVNLWDYIPKNEDLVDDSAPEKIGQRSEKHYKLSFFYTERGASGSTCWMQFTLPELRSSTFRTPTSTDYATLEIGKTVEGPRPAEGQKFHFVLQLKNADGSFPKDITASVYQTGGSTGDMGEIEGIDWLANQGKLEFDLEDGQTIILKDLPKDIQYTITEAPYEGYVTSWATTDEDLNSGTKTVTPGDGATTEGTLQGGHIVTALCRNSSSYELPSTGGAGMAYTMAWAPLLAAGCLWYKKRSRREGAEDGA